MLQRMLVARRLAACVLSLIGLASQCCAFDAVTLAEPAADVRVRLVATEVRTDGKVYTNAGNGKSNEHPLSAMAAFRYRERRLPPGGREAQSLRALREFELATLQTRVANHDTSVDLPAGSRLVVARGERSGIQCYAPGAPMTRESADLLELPGDPLILTALLPLTPVEIGAEWKPSDWVSQMLASIEAIDAINITCRLAAADARTATVEFSGSVRGQKFGANTEIGLTGEMTFDREQEFIRAATIHYTIKSSIGTINPGIDAKVDVTIERSAATSSGRLTSAVADAIPLEPAPADLLLTFPAAPWGIQFRHDRQWHVFQALLEGTPRVVILRLMEQGSLISQCNISPIAAAPPGKHTPLEQFQADIRQALGDKFKRIAAQDTISTDDGRTILRVLTEGEMLVKGEKADVSIPTNWIYYICADRSGKQVSLVFVIEPAYMEMLAGRDLELVKSLTFSAP